MRKSLAAAAVTAASFVLPVGLRTADAAPAYPPAGSTVVCTASYHHVNTNQGLDRTNTASTEGSGTCVDSGLQTYPFVFTPVGPGYAGPPAAGCPAVPTSLFFDIGKGHYGYVLWEPASLLLGLGLLNPLLPLSLSLGELAGGSAAPQILVGPIDDYGPGSRAASAPSSAPSRASRGHTGSRPASPGTSTGGRSC